MSSTNKKGAGLILSLLTAVAGAVGLAFCMGYAPRRCSATTCGREMEEP